MNVLYRAIRFTYRGNLEYKEAHRIYNTCAEKYNKPIVDLPEINVAAFPRKENTRVYITAAFPTVFRKGFGDPHSGYYVQPEYDEWSVYIMRRDCWRAQSHMRLRYSVYNTRGRDKTISSRIFL